MQGMEGGEGVGRGGVGAGETLLCAFNQSLLGGQKKWSPKVPGGRPPQVATGARSESGSSHFLYLTQRA